MTVCGSIRALVQASQVVTDVPSKPTHLHCEDQAGRQFTVKFKDVELAVGSVVLLDNGPKVVAMGTDGDERLVEGQVAAVEDDVARGLVHVHGDVARAGEEKSVEVDFELEVIVGGDEGAWEPQAGEGILGEGR